MPRFRVHSDPYAPDTTAALIPCPGAHNDNARADPEAARHLVYGDPVWCRRCADAVRSAIQFLPGLARALEQEIEDATDLTPERVSGTRARALHEHQAQALLIDEIRDAMAQLEDLVREWRRLIHRRTGRPIHTSIANSSKFLLAHLDWLLTSAPDADDPDERALVRCFVEHLRALDRRAMRLTHQSEAKPEPCVGVPCKRPGCGLKTLVRAVERNGADKGEIVCESCGLKLTLDEFHDEAKRWGIYEYEHLDTEQRARHAHEVAAYERTRVAA